MLTKQINSEIESRNELIDNRRVVNIALINEVEKNYQIIKHAESDIKELEVLKTNLKHIKREKTNGK